MERIQLAQMQSPFFRELPSELRNAIYLDILTEPGPMLHIFRSRTPSRLYEMAGGHVAFKNAGAIMRKPSDKKRFRHEPCIVKAPPMPRIDRVVYGIDGTHWRQKPGCTLLAMLLVCKRMYDESLPLMGSAIPFVFTDMKDARKFLLECPPPIVKEIKVMHMAWGVIWSTAPSRAPSTANDSSKPQKPTKIRALYQDVWQSIIKFPRLQEAVCWIDWYRHEGAMSQMTSVRYVQGGTVEGEEEVVSSLMKSLPDVVTNGDSVIKLYHKTIGA